MLAFVRATEKDGKPQPPQLYLLSMEGGEARALTELPKGAGGPVWSPDGHTIAFSSTTIPADLEEKKDGDKKDAEKKDEEDKSDVRVIVKATYRANGSGYLEPGSPYAHLDHPSSEDRRRRAQAQASDVRRIQRERHCLLARRFADLFHFPARRRTRITRSLTPTSTRSSATGGDIHQDHGTRRTHPPDVAQPRRHAHGVRRRHRGRQRRRAAILQPVRPVHHFAPARLHSPKLDREL